ncbi:hypothetical protein GGI1_12178 [Acidithiobacillus sp. GGI-221]|nr:hypothetical protein GGI1_12178 [Acidithiobacillus sp. GGI-221]
MFKSKTKRQLTSIQEVIKNHSNGIYKRIDENRELMELLALDHGPDFLERNSWVASWLESQDAFLDALREAAGMPAKKLGGSLEGYPRPRPSYEPCHEPIPYITADAIRQRFEENLTLIYTFQHHAPDGFMRENRWVDGFLHWQGEFIAKVATVFGVPLPQQPVGCNRANTCSAIGNDGAVVEIPSHNADYVAPGVNTCEDEPKNVADEFTRLKEKRKQLYAIEHACRQSNGAIGGPRFNFAAGCGSVAFLAVLALLWWTRLPGLAIFLCSVTACISVFFLTYQHSTRPLEWDGLIDKLLAGYDPIDMESYRRLQTDVGEKGHIDQWRVRDWVSAESTSIRIARHGVTGPYDFLRKIV